MLRPLGGWIKSLTYRTKFHQLIESQRRHFSSSSSSSSSIDSCEGFVGDTAQSVAIRSTESRWNQIASWHQRHQRATMNQQFMKLTSINIYWWLRLRFSPSEKVKQWTFAVFLVGKILDSYFAKEAATSIALGTNHLYKTALTSTDAFRSSSGIESNCASRLIMAMEKSDYTNRPQNQSCSVYCFLSFSWKSNSPQILKDVLGCFPVISTYTSASENL